MANPSQEQPDHSIEAIDAQDRPAIRETLAGRHPADIGLLSSAPPGDRVKDHFDSESKVFKVMDLDEDVVEQFQKYNLVSAPVIDGDCKLIGRLTIDDVVDAIRETADRSVMARAGLSTF